MPGIQTVIYMMDDCLDPRHGSDDGWSAHSYVNPILGFMGELGYSYMNPMGNSPWDPYWGNWGIGDGTQEESHSLGSMMDDCLDPRHGRDDGWSALSYMNPILVFMGEMGALGN